MPDSLSVVVLAAVALHPLILPAALTLQRQVGFHLCQAVLRDPIGVLKVSILPIHLEHVAARAADRPTLRLVVRAETVRWALAAVVVVPA
jgi:hypothetical protein